jgi:hypothetical protein
MPGLKLLLRNCRAAAAQLRRRAQPGKTVPAVLSQLIPAKAIIVRPTGNHENVRESFVEHVGDVYQELPRLAGLIRITDSRFI